MIAERCLGVTAEPWDIDGKTGAVDALLHYPDGRVAAFEITLLAEAGALQTESLLANDEFQWPSSAQWHWSITVGSPRDLLRLKASYGRIIDVCEAAGTGYPHNIGWERNADPDVRWLVSESSSTMLGNPRVPAGAYVRVMPEGGGGAVDLQLTGLAAALCEAFGQQHIRRHFEKLELADTDERHLFIPLHYTALPDGVSLGLMFDNVELPPDSPPVPERLTHLWLVPQFSRRVLLWSRNAGWCNYFPYD